MDIRVMHDKVTETDGAQWKKLAHGTPFRDVFGARRGVQATTKAGLRSSTFLFSLWALECLECGAGGE